MAGWQYAVSNLKPLDFVDVTRGKALLSCSLNNEICCSDVCVTNNQRTATIEHGISDLLQFSTQTVQPSPCFVRALRGRAACLLYKFRHEHVNFK